MKIIIDFIDWTKRNWANIKLGFVLVLIALCTFSMIGRRVEKKKAIDYATKNAELRTFNQMLESKNKVLDVRVRNLKGEKQSLIDSLNASEAQRKANEKEKEVIAAERDALREKLAQMSSNELYSRLNELYPFEGEREYLINIKQVGEIVYVTLDYSLVKKEKDILIQDVSDCNRQVKLSKALNIKNDSIISSLESINVNQDEIILNLEEQVDVKDKEIKRGKRKLFRTKVGMGAVIVIEAIVLITTVFGL